ncbi:MAG: phage portal protein, partial [Lachnospiraceae bacterium]
EFKMAFEMLLYFVDEYLKLIGKGDFTQRDMEIVFNRDMAVNETEIIQNCLNSKGTISDETIIARHPFTSDVEEELAKLEEQKKNEEPTWDKTPIPLGGGTNVEEQ